MLLIRGHFSMSLPISPLLQQVRLTSPVLKIHFVELTLSEMSTVTSETSAGVPRRHRPAVTRQKPPTGAVESEKQ